jgi:N-methylhydantoinase A
MADYVRQYNRTVNWIVVDASQVGRVNEILEDMRAEAVADARRDGIAVEDLTFSISGDGCFAGQVWEITVPLPDRQLTVADGEELASEFPTIYERTYGPGTAWLDSPALMVNLSVKVTMRRPKPVTREREPMVGFPAVRHVSVRDVYLPIERRMESVPVYAEADVVPGSAVDGPAIVDVGDTTVYVPTGATCGRDRFYNFIISNTH